jgi:hypothetical protein
MGPKALGRYKKAYDKLLTSGFFWEFYPHLSGEWHKDKDTFIKNEQFLQKRRNSLKRKK